MDDLTIDTGQLQKIGVPNDAVVSRTVERFIHELDQRVAAISNAAARKELSTVARLSHQLRGSATTCGCSAIGRLCSVVESSPESFDQQAFESTIAVTISAWRSLGLRNQIGAESESTQP